MVLCLGLEGQLRLRVLLLVWWWGRLLGVWLLDEQLRVGLMLLVFM